MYDIKPLEEKWKIYNNKKKKPFYLLLVGIILILSLFLLFGQTNIFEKYSKKLDNLHVKSFTKKVLSTPSSILLNNALTRIEVMKVPTKKGAYTETKKEDEILVDIPILDIEETSDVSDTSDGKVHLNIIETTSISAYEDVETRFHQSHDIDDALFLARSYYAKGNYKKSETWAYEVNKINPDFEESLFIFIKSKFMNGRKNEALSLLRNYIKKSNSIKAQNLLYKMENNKL